MWWIIAAVVYLAIGGLIAYAARDVIGPLWASVIVAVFWPIFFILFMLGVG